MPQKFERRLVSLEPFILRLKERHQFRQRAAFGVFIEVSAFAHDVAAIGVGGAGENGFGATIDVSFHVRDEQVGFAVGTRCRAEHAVGCVMELEVALHDRFEAVEAG